MKKMVLGLCTFTVLTTAVTAKDISTYLYANIKNSENVKKNLALKGFDIVGEYDAMGNSNYHIIAFTNEKLKLASAKNNRGFASVQKVLVDKKNSKLVFTNPQYFLRAFLQDDFNKNISSSIYNSLNSSFGELTGSTDTLEDSDIKDFHYMFGMPYYDDMVQVGEGENLLERLKKNASNNIVFVIELKNSTLVGISMPTKDGEKFYVPKISGESHSSFLPYMVLIENKKAKIMHAKYYLAISFPELSMGNFMSISDTPDEIKDYMTSLFKK